MNRVMKVAVVAGQEFSMLVKNKTYIVTTLLGPFLLGAMMILPGLLSYKSMSEDRRISLGLYCEDPALREELGELLSPSYDVEKTESRDEIISLIENENLDGGLIVPAGFYREARATYLSATGTDIQVHSRIEDRLEDLLLKKSLADIGLGEEAYEKLTRPVKLGLTKAGSEEEGDEESYLATLFTSMSVVMLLYMTIYIYGFSIGRSVVRERTSNTVDILLSSVKPESLMAGKLLGVGSAGIVQIFAWILIILAVVTYGGGRIPGSAAELLNPGNLFTIIPFYFLGFMLYGAAFLSIGSFSETDQQLQQAGIPLILMLIVPMVAMSALINQPESALMKGLNLFPFTSPLTMPVRIMVGRPAAWEVGASLLLLAAAIAFTLWVSARIFRVGILIKGSAVKIKDVIRLTFRERSRE